MRTARSICLGVILLITFSALTDAQWFGSSKKKKEEDPNVSLLSYAPIDPDAVPPQPDVTSTTTSTTTPAPTTTKKKGFFGGLFGGGSKKDKEATTTSTTTTTTTTPKPTATTKKSGGFFGGLFGGGKKDKTTTTVAPSTTKAIPTTTAKSAAVTPTVKAAVPSTAATPTTSTVKSAKDVPIPSVPTTAASAPKPPPIPPKPVSSTPKTIDAFPPLPPKSGSPTPASVPTSTVASAWNKPLPTQPPASPEVGKPGVSFVPTQPPAPGATTKTTPRYSEGPTATDEELATLSEQLFSKDTSQLNKYVRPNYQRQTLSSSSLDEAPEPFLSVDERQVYAVPTVEKMRALFNNYEVDTMVNEYVTPMEKKEENDFVDALLATNVMRTAMLFLQKKGVVTADPKTHHELLKTIWFQLYSRGNGKIGSSGFEHVFLNEVSNGTMIGLHNWVYLYEQEKTGTLDYQGYIKKLDLGNKGEIAKIRLTYNKLSKPSNSLFVATSPELEIALYTVCFQMRPDTECPLAVNGKKFTIKTFTFRYRGKNLIGGAWPNF
ncbi:endoribonuclease CG2145-like [Wyeomyia smithii]|uniref:endoribonuclease CG2145-like n=1 Tax=Wyeomyia smithii TaxID=174621 RepID=UPI002467B846|nr:endoribonuclease CG2145-like [Wyeomyia smithii]